jgi:hypothetical protein
VPFRSRGLAVSTAYGAARPGCSSPAPAGEPLARAGADVRLGRRRAPVPQVHGAAIDSFGADRLVLGTDFPYEAGDIFVRAIDYITDPEFTKDEGG